MYTYTYIYCVCVCVKWVEEKGGGMTKRARFLQNRATSIVVVLVNHPRMKLFSSRGKERPRVSLGLHRVTGARLVM